jgi:hypothetical protein
MSGALPAPLSPRGEVARRNGRVMHPLVQWFRLSDTEQTTDWPDGWRVDQPDDGWFDPEALAVLTKHLSVATRTPDDLVVGAWEGTGNPPWADGGRNELARSLAHADAVARSGHVAVQLELARAR